MREIIKVKVEKMYEDVILPIYAHEGDSCCDVYSQEDVYIKAQQTVIVSTGLKFAIPFGYEIEVRPRSGISAKTPLRISNSPGTVDSQYLNEFGVIITNTSVTSNPSFSFDLTTKGNRQGDYRIRKGDRIAQLAIKKSPMMEFEVVDDIKKTSSEDRGGGFGSTGV